MDKEYRKLARTVEDQGASIRRELSLFQESLMSLIDDLKLAVAANSEVTTSAVLLLQNLSSKIQSAVSNQDLPAIQQILDEVNADSRILAEAVAANTPAASEVTSTPPSDGISQPVANPEPQPSEPVTPPDIAPVDPNTPST